MEPRFKQEIQQMMYIAGETQDVSTPTIKLIEDIIRDQVLVTANDLAARRFVDEADLDDDAVAGPADDAPANKATKLPTVTFPWDMSSFFAEHVAHISPDDLADITSSAAALEKLLKNDELTRDMTVAEYATWSEYRHASLTYRKAKRFREWCGLGIIADNRPNDDTMDILGFLTSEMVHNLTAEALRVQGQELGRAGQCAVIGSEISQRAKGGLFAEPEGVRKAIDGKHIRVAFHRLQIRPKKGRAFLNGARTSPSLSLI
ncbi:transcription initiation protein Spt3 [Diaporthe eres]|nr:transcription initiation protein Spt3 [Diaporthe eres]